MNNYRLIGTCLCGIVLEAVFASLPAWPNLADWIDSEQYSFQDRQYFYTFTILGLFSCITGLVAAWKDHHFIYINVIWLASFIAASYLIKLIWELIFYFLTAPSQTWLIWIKYVCGLVIYTVQVIFALMDRARILRHYFTVSVDEISKHEIDILYEKLARHAGPETHHMLAQNRHHLEQVLLTMRAGSRSPVSAPMSQAGWNTSSTIQAMGHVKQGTSTTDFIHRGASSMISTPPIITEETSLTH